MPSGGRARDASDGGVVLGWLRLSRDVAVLALARVARLAGGATLERFPSGAALAAGAVAALAAAVAARFLLGR